ICDSEYNATEARALGYHTVVTVPIVIDANRLSSATPAVPRWLPPDGAGPVVLFVGRIAPGKGHPALLATFHVLKTYLRPDAHLIIVGGIDVPSYQRALHTYASELGLTDVMWGGRVTDAELAAIYRRASVFVSLSAHEGFGLPLVEAMSFG